VKWFVDEPGADVARFLESEYAQGTLDITAPTVLKYEVASALRWHPLARLKKREVLSALEVIDEYRFLVEPTSQTWDLAVELSYASNISIYDAVYVSLAQTAHSLLVTADDKLISLLPPSARKSVLGIDEFGRMLPDFIRETEHPHDLSDEDR
jgi:predicted nucleic acid-binding protein